MSQAEDVRPDAYTSPFTDYLGLEFVEASPDRLVARLDADERHHRPFGMVHGGVHASVVETVASVGGYLRVHDDGMSVVGVNNATDFIRPHSTGGLEAVGTPIHLGRTQHLWQVEIRRTSDGKLVARGQVRLQVVPAEQP